MKKSEIWMVNQNQAMGKEQAGMRPVVIISNDGMNEYLMLSIVCPLTTRIKNFIGGVILQPSEDNGLNDISEVLSFQIRTVAHTRFIKKIGKDHKEEKKILIENINKILRINWANLMGLLRSLNYRFPTFRILHFAFLILPN